MKLIWSPLATQNAHDLASFIAQDKPSAAVTWLTDLFERVESLIVLSESGRVVPEIGVVSIREVIFGQYRVIYRIKDREITILTVRHGKRLLNTQRINAMEASRRGEVEKTSLAELRALLDADD